MRFFCTQPDIVEDVQAVRYNTHTKSKSTATTTVSSPPRIVPHHSNSGTFKTINTPPVSIPLADQSNRSRTNLHNVFAGKKFFSSHSSEQRKLSISSPIPITTPNIAATPIVSPASNVSLPAAKPASFDGKPRSFDIKPKSYNADSKAQTDTEGLGFRRKSRRMSAPFVAALRLGGGGEESGTDTGGKRAKRVSKMAIGAPEGFKHEGHVGVGETFTTAPEDRDTWNVETWRAEIERTLKHNSAPTPSRPKGPRPSSITPDPSPRRHRGSIDGPAPRWSIDRERERDGAPRWSGERERDGTVSDYPIGRPVTAPGRGSIGSNTSHREARHSRSRSGSHNSPSSAQSAQSGGPPMIVGVHSNSLRGPRLAVDGQFGMGHGQGHVPGKDSITSLSSTPTTITTLSSNTIITPTTTTTSLNRSLSDKPHYSHHQHQRSLPQGYEHHQQSSAGNAWEWNYANGNLQRASSANAATAVNQTARYAPSSNTSTSTAASYTSSTTATNTTRKPGVRRKPVPQHLPATAEVSPFPTLLVVNSTTPTTPNFPFDINPAVERKERQRFEEEKKKGWRDEQGQVKKEMVPLLGVPNDGAQYVTKSTKARWDGAMAEIANALRDPEATPPV